MTEIRDGCHGRFTDEQISRKFPLPIWFIHAIVVEFMCTCIVMNSCLYSFVSAVAIRRLYEGIRRQHLNHRPENMQKAQEHDLKKKYRARRERVRFGLVSC